MQPSLDGIKNQYRQAPAPRLLIISTVSATLQAFLLPFAAHFRNKGWRVDAAAYGVTRAPRCIDSFDRCYDIEWTRKVTQVRGLQVSFKKIQRLVVENNYDIVHVHTPIAAFVTRYALRTLRKRDNIKVIYTVHGFHFYRGGKPAKNTVFRTLEQVAGRWTDYLVVINREDEQAAMRYGIVPPARLVYMPGIGVDTERLDPALVSADTVAEVRNELGLQEDDILFLMVAEFNPGKRHRDLLQAMALLREPKVHIAFAGTGVQQKAMEDLAATLGLSGRTHFLNFRTDIPVLMRAAVACVLPSEREGLPRSVMESLSLETPVVGANTRGIRDLLASGSGLLTPVGDIEQLAVALTWMVRHSEERIAMGKLGRRQMQEYDVRHITALHERLYIEALQSHGE